MVSLINFSTALAIRFGKKFFGISPSGGKLSCLPSFEINSRPGRNCFGLCFLNPLGALLTRGLFYNLQCVIDLRQLKSYGELVGLFHVG